jgi:hypothetical protein
MSKAESDKRIYTFAYRQYISIDKGGEIMRRINPVFPQLMPDVDPNYFSQLNTQAPMGTFEKGKFDQPATLPFVPFMGGCCPVPRCRVIVSECPPIITCSKQVIEDYHIVKQPHIHNHHTEIIHHHIKQDEFIPRNTCSERHVIDSCGCGPRI